jgi:RNA polymerase sigma-70 factor (ECF subfamily)
MNFFRQIASNGLNRPVPPDSTSGGGLAGGSEVPEKSATNQPADDSGASRKEDAAEDSEWVKKAQSGDMRAFDRLVSKHRGKIYAMIYNMVKNDADAWDLSQEAFIKAWKALPKFEARARFSTWLFRISHNVVYDWLRKRRIEGEGELNDEIFDASRIDPGAVTAPNHDMRPDEAMEKSELRDQINAAIAKLSEEHREVILLREVQGLDYKEIAEITENSIGTVMSRLHYARKKLQGILRPNP